MKTFIRLPIFARAFERGAVAVTVMAACIVSAQNDQLTRPSGNSRGAGAANLESNNVNNAEANTSATGEMKATGATAMTAESFIKEAAKGDNFEISMAKIAEQKAQSPQVRQYAQMIQRDHQKALQQLRPIAQAHGVSLAAEGNVNQEQMDKLQQAGGANFDKQYIEGMLRDHQKDIAKFQSAAQHLQASDVKQYAENCVPVLQKHLEHAKQAAQQIGISQSQISSILNEAGEAVGGTGENQENETGSFTNSNSNVLKNQ